MSIHFLPVFIDIFLLFLTKKYMLPFGKCHFPTNKHILNRIYSYANAIFNYSKFIMTLIKRIYRTTVCFYIISYTIYNCITTVYRIYGSHAVVVVIAVAVRIEQVIAVQVTVVDIAKPEIRIRVVWIAVYIARRKPENSISKK